MQLIEMNKFPLPPLMKIPIIPIKLAMEMKEVVEYMIYVLITPIQSVRL